MASTCTYCDHYGGYLAWDDDQQSEIPMCPHCYGEPHDEEPCTLPDGSRAHFNADGKRISPEFQTARVTPIDMAPSISRRLVTTPEGGEAA